MRELIEAGWVLRQEIRKGGRGTFAGLEYVVLDEPEQAPPTEGKQGAEAASPESENPTAVPESGKPESAYPESGKPESGEPEAVNPTAYQELESTKGFSPLNPPVAGGTRSVDEQISEREALAGRRPDPSSARRPRAERGCRGAALTPVAPPSETLAQFERLWVAYPASGRLPADRAESLARFGALSPTDQEAAIRAASVEAKTRAETRSQAKALHRWLRDGRWRNGELALGAIGTAGTAAAGVTRVFVQVDSPEWEAWAAHYRQIGRVMPSPTRIGNAEGWRFDSVLPPKDRVA